MSNFCNNHQASMLIDMSTDNYWVLLIDAQAETVSSHTNADWPFDIWRQLILGLPENGNIKYENDGFIYGK